MPELPEVETMCRGIGAVVGLTIECLRFPRSDLCDIEMSPGKPTFRRRVEGRSVAAIRRIGKRAVIDLSSGDSVVFEPRMTGRLLLSEPPDQRHVRAVFEFADPTRASLIVWSMRGLSTLHLLTPGQLAAVTGPDRLGPDALEVTAQQLYQRLRRSRRHVKVALLDQKVVAGIGNIYASEILHRARLHPATRCSQISLRSWRRIQQETVTVLTEAIQARGSTLRDGNYRTVSDEPGGFQDRHRVYGRQKLRCLQCGRGTILRIVQAQRSTYFCPTCQRSGKD